MFLQLITTSKTGFSDVNESTAEGQAIVKMYEAGYIKGYEMVLLSLMATLQELN